MRLRIAGATLTPFLGLPVAICRSASCISAGSSEGSTETARALGGLREGGAIGSQAARRRLGNADRHGEGELIERRWRGWTLPELRPPRDIRRCRISEIVRDA